MPVYDFDVELDLDDFLKALAEDARETAERNSPQRKGNYAKGWKTKKVKGGYIVYNENYRLPHLLENGHLSKNLGWVKGKKHIIIAEDAVKNSISRRADKIKINIKS